MAIRNKPGVPKLDRAQQTAPAAPAAPATQSMARNEAAGSYYSPREYHAQSGVLGAQVQERKAAMEQQAAVLRERQKAMEELYANANKARENYYNTRGKFVGDTASEYEQRMLDKWTEAVQAYSASYKEYQGTLDTYRPYEGAYNQAVTAYNDYNAREDAEYQAWRATVRDAETVRAERAEIGKLRQELRLRMQQANDIASGSAAPGIQAQAQQNEERIRELQAYLGGIGEREKLLEEELGWSEKLRWEELRQNADFVRESRYGRQNTDYLYNWINTGGKADPMGLENPVSAPAEYLHMDEREIAMYNYAYSTQGAEGAKAYLEYLRPELSQRRGDVNAEAQRAWAGENPGWASGISVALSPVSGVVSAAGQVAAKLMGEELDPNAGYNALSNTKNNLREGVAQKIEQSLGDFWGPAGSFAYNIGMSMADMLADSLTGNPAASMALIGSRSFAESTIDAKNRGLSDAQAMSLGLTSAAAELLTERIGLDELLKLPDGWQDAGFWKGLLKGAAGEAGEEGLTNLANLVADIGIAGEKSEFAQNVEAYRKAGKSDQEALLAALKDAGISLAADALGGAISGGVFGGVQGFRGKRAANAQRNEENAANMAAGEAGEAVSFENHAEIKGSSEVAHPSLKEAALRENNPLISGVAPSVTSQEKADRIAKATTNAQVTGILYDVDEKAIEQADRIGRMIGREIFFFSENPTEHGIKHGLYDAGTNAIGVNVKSRNVMAATIGHELTHSVETAQNYEKLKNLVFERIAQTGESLDAMRQSRQELYRRNGVSLDAQGIDREIVAKYVEEHLLTDEESIRALVRDDRSVAKRILDWVDGLLAKFGSKKSQEREFVRRSRDIYRAALAEADRIRRNQELTKAARDAYIAGDDAVGDALTDERYGDDMDSLLEDDFDKYDPSYDDELEFSFGGVNAAGEKKKRLPNTGDERTVFVEGDSPAARSESIVDQMRGALPEIMEMESVAVIDENNAVEFGGGRAANRKRGYAVFAEQGGFADRPGFGRVALSMSGAKETVHHGTGPAKQAAFPAIKAAIEHGLEIAYDYKHKGKDFDTVTFAAPIEFFGAKSPLGVVVKVFNNGRGEKSFYIHEICDAEGNYIRFGEKNAKKEASNTDGPNSNLGAGVADSEVSLENSVPDSERDVKQYSIGEVDSEGRELTEEQQEYFQDSVVRDADGNLLVMYHGTPNGSHTKFRSGTYFTAEREYADKYQSPNASMLSVKKNAGAPKTYEVYLNITKPFDTRKPRERKIFMTEYYRQWGLGAPLAKSGLPDWTDGMDLQEFIEEMGYDYDGLILDEGATGGYGMEVKSRGLSYVTFSPDQVKNVDNKTPTSDPDIRYSIGAPDEMTDAERAEVEDLPNRADAETDTVAGRNAWDGVERSDITGKAREHLEGAERQLAAKIAAALDVPRQAKWEFLQPIVEELTAEYMTNGTISQAVRDRLFETAWGQGRVVDREFYDTYKEIKDYLRTTGVTLSETDRDNRDWAEFRKSAFGAVKIVNEGGLPVDTAWGELQEMAPALFPADILNPEDMLKHMVEVGRSIRKVERTLDEHYGADAKYAKQITRNDFDAAIADGIRSLWEVKRYADERMAESAAVTAEDGEELTAEAVMALYPKLKDARKAAEKAVARNLLTKRDKEQVQRLLRHDIQPEHLDPGRDNVKGIMAVYEAKRAFEEAAEPIRKWNRQRKAGLYAQAEELIAGAGRIEDKKRGILYSRETMERNIRDIVGNKEAAERIVGTYFKPVHQGAAAAVRMKNEFRERVRKLNLSRKVEKGNTVSEAYAVQFYGEVSDILRLMEQSKFRLKHRDGKNYLEWKAELQKLWEENPNLDQEKVKAAAREFGKIYEELFTQMNEARVRNGYEPINHRSGYFPHFQQDGRDGILGQFGKALGIDVEVQQLPTTINGLTHTFKPGIRWFGNALERKGFDTAYDAVEGFDRYIEGVADVVHQTDNIQRLRALANQLRYRTSDEGLRKQIRKIQERTDLSDEEKDALIRDKTKDGRFELSNFVVELDEYTNLLANKKSRADRNMEQAMGRDMYNIVKSLEGRVAANMVAINPGSWLTNFIPITQGWACLDTRHLLGGLKDTLKAMKNDDGMMDRSDFLTGRKGTDALVKTWAQEWSGKLSSPMEWIDTFTAGSLVRGRYRQNLALGLGESEALQEADEWTAGVMADRSKGSMPTLFHRSNPLTKLFTQFQLEVNNQLSYLWKDVPREKRDKGKKALALALLKFAVGAWLYNWLYEWAFGRRPALDPIDMLTGAVGDVMDPEQDLADAAMNLGGKVAENTPFIGGLLGGGRVPISSALPDAENLVKAVGNSEWSAGKRLGTAAKELAKPAVYMLPPFGGGQIKKVWEGLKMIAQGGSYTLDAKGNPMLQYPLYSTDSGVQKALEAGQAMLFGKTTIRSGREWVEGGFGNLTAEQTATYKALIGMDVEQADAFELLTALREAEKTDEQSRAAIQRDILRQSGLDGDALGTVYYDLLASSDREKEMLEQLLGDGTDMGKATNAVMDIKDAQTSNERRNAIMASGLTDQQKRMIYRTMISESWDEEMDTFANAGLDVNDFLEAQNAHADIKEQHEDESDMATAFARWVNRQGYSAAQKEVVRESLKYWQMMPAQADRYDKAVKAGLDDGAAYDLAQDLDALEPPDGKASVQEVQKWRVAIDNSLNEDNQLMLLKAVGMNEKTYAKVEAAWGQGIAPAAYVRAQELKGQYDSDGNGSLTNEDWKKLIDGMTTSGIVLPGDNNRFMLTQEQKGYLWQMLTGSKSTKNNPYSKSGGEKWLKDKAGQKG